MPIEDDTGADSGRMLGSRSASLVVLALMGDEDGEHRVESGGRRDEDVPDSCSASRSRRVRGAFQIPARAGDGDDGGWKEEARVASRVRV